jgi:hypothetical protein
MRTDLRLLREQIVKRRTSLGALAAGLGAAVLASISAAAANVGSKAPAFDVLDSTSKGRNLSAFAGKIMVLEWTSPSCPFVRAQYVSGKMQEAQRFG